MKIDTKRIPEEVKRAVGIEVWEYLRENCPYAAEEAIILAIFATWPGALKANNGSSICLEPHIILPLSRETGDGENTDGQYT